MKRKNTLPSQETITTLDYYNNNALKYINNTRSVEFTDKHKILLKYLKPGAHILDLGCGSGRDSKAFIKQAYQVTALDGSEEMCQLASEYIEQEVICKRFEDINEKDTYDAIWACASLLHVPLAELPNLLSKLILSLKSGGYLYASFKHGDFEGEIRGRYFTYLNEERLACLLEGFNELELKEVQITGDVRYGRECEEWLNLIVKKTNKR